MMNEKGCKNKHFYTLPPKILVTFGWNANASHPFHSAATVNPEKPFQRLCAIQKIMLNHFSFWALWLPSDLDMTGMHFLRVLSDHFEIVVNQSSRNLVVESIALDCGCLPNNSCAFPGHENRCDQTLVGNLSMVIAIPKEVVY